jgi:predicted alpha/beta-hydrolase family hydrolase
MIVEHRPISPTDEYVRNVYAQSAARLEKLAEKRQLNAEERRSLEVVRHQLAAMDRGETRTANQPPSRQANPRDDYRRRAAALRRRMFESHKADMVREAVR